MKKILSFIVVLALTICSMSIVGYAAENVKNNSEYNTNEVYVLTSEPSYHPEIEELVLQYANEYRKENFISDRDLIINDLCKTNADNRTKSMYKAGYLTTYCSRDGYDMLVSDNLYSTIEFSLIVDTNGMQMSKEYWAKTIVQNRIEGIGLTTADFDVTGLSIYGDENALYVIWYMADDSNYDNYLNSYYNNFELDRYKVAERHLAKKAKKGIFG